jgi:hypothetical protein
VSAGYDSCVSSDVRLGPLTPKGLTLQAVRRVAVGPRLRTPRADGPPRVRRLALRRPGVELAWDGPIVQCVGDAAAIDVLELRRAVPEDLQ